MVTSEVIQLVRLLVPTTWFAMLVSCFIKHTFIATEHSDLLQQCNKEDVQVIIWPLSHDLCKYLVHKMYYYSPDITQSIVVLMIAWAGYNYTS